jgi:hypothetical protein
MHPEVRQSVASARDEARTACEMSLSVSWIVG